MSSWQRRLLQGCRALVERRFDVRVLPPAKGEAEGRGTVTGQPEDVADALAELKQLLHPDSQKGGSGKSNNDNKNGKHGKNNNKKDDNDGRDTRAKGQSTKQKKKH